LLPTPAVVLKAVLDVDSTCALPAAAWPGMPTPRPVVAVAGPDQYATALLGSVSGVVAVPVVNDVAVTAVVHAPSSSPRASVTVTAPSCAVIVAAPTAAEPRAAVAGVVMLSAPALRMKVTVVSPDGAA
jgi:hypothetical protein